MNCVDFSGVKSLGGILHLLLLLPALFILLIEMNQTSVQRGDSLSVRISPFLEEVSLMLAARQSGKMERCKTCFSYILKRDSFSL